jgi:hypothetical protein
MKKIFVIVAIFAACGKALGQSEDVPEEEPGTEAPDQNNKLAVEITTTTEAPEQTTESFEVDYACPGVEAMNVDETNENILESFQPALTSAAVASVFTTNAAVGMCKTTIVLRVGVSASDYAAGARRRSTEPSFSDISFNIVLPNGDLVPTTATVAAVEIVIPEARPVACSDGTCSAAGGGHGKKSGKWGSTKGKAHHRRSAKKSKAMKESKATKAGKGVKGGKGAKAPKKAAPTGSGPSKGSKGKKAKTPKSGPKGVKGPKGPKGGKSPKTPPAPTPAPPPAFDCNQCLLFQALEAPPAVDNIDSGKKGKKGKKRQKDD